MGRTRKLPSREEVVRLYVEDGLGTPQIAKRFGLTDPHGVRVQLVKAGIKLRKHTVPTVCIEKGCTKKVSKVRHPKFGLYGRRCAEHQKKHRKTVCADFGKRDRAARPELLRERFAAWANRLRTMTFDQLLEEIKEKPCQFKKDELVRKLRKLNGMGRSKEAIDLTIKSFPTLRRKQA